MRQDVQEQLVLHLKSLKLLFNERAKKTALDLGSENVHDLRVTVRRIRAVVWLVKRGSPKISCGKLEKSLRKLGHSLGDLRQLGVAIQDASKYKLEIKNIRPRFKKAKQSILCKIDSNHLKMISHQIEIILHELEAHQELDLRDGFYELRKTVRPYIRNRSLNNEEAHKLRIAARKVRYALRVVGRPVPALRKLQDCLGRGHDLVVLQELTNRNERIQRDINRQYGKGKKLLKPTLNLALEQIERIVHDD